jgi:polynucleotide 5'-hydroxyl-kinase GRC3/NOL9
MERTTLAGSRTLLVSGPASLVLVQGEAEILGAPVEREEKLLVREEKQIPVEAMTDSVFQVSLGETGSCKEIDGTSIPSSWKALVEAVLERSCPTVLVIGPTDSGKSTLCTYLANMLSDKHPSISVIDADVGQSDIGPPATIGLGQTTGYLFSLADLDPVSLFFVGHTSPTSVEEKVISGIRKLMERRPSNDPLIINTDGWVAGDEACAFKAKMVSEISPDIVATIQADNSLSSIVNAARTTSIVVQSPTTVRKRNRDERRRLRELSYRKHLTDSITRNISFNEVRLKGVAMRNGRLRAAPQRLHSLVGFLSDDDFLLDIGILRSVEQREGMLRILTPFKGIVRTIEFGAVKLDDSGKELPYYESTA